MGGSPPPRLHAASGARFCRGRFASLPLGAQDQLDGRPLDWLAAAQSTLLPQQRHGDLSPAF